MRGRGAPYFSGGYAEARERFRSAAATTGASLHSLPLDARGPKGEALTIDIAWLGSPRADRALIHSSGLHGVEGFAGSAIQLALLDNLPRLPEDGAFILTHILNPYGMAWSRRVNENNVDLNRNFLLDEEKGAPVAEGYRRVERFLNPPGLPRADFFYARAAALVLRHGLQPLTQAVAQGQYAFPKGLFFGGLRREQGVARYMEWLRLHLGPVTRGLAIDVHTGLGRRGQESLLVRRGTGDPGELGTTLARPMSFDGGDGSIGYRIHGGHGGAFEALSTKPRIAFITQEFGAYPPLRVLHALREENRWHHWGGGALDHPSKAHLREMFAPASRQWREWVVERGLSLARAASGHVLG